jgi:hypothetical protein
MIYYLRYNVDHKNGKSDLPWKLFEAENKFFLSKEVKINVSTWTRGTLVDGGSFKYSIYCDGTLTVCDENLIEIN